MAPKAQVPHIVVTEPTKKKEAFKFDLIAKVHGTDGENDFHASFNSDYSIDYDQDEDDTLKDWKAVVSISANDIEFAIRHENIPVLIRLLEEIQTRYGAQILESLENRKIADEGR
jgi:hypothetical protein